MADTPVSPFNDDWKATIVSSAISVSVLQFVLKKHASPSGQPYPVGQAVLHFVLASLYVVPQYFDA